MKNSINLFLYLTICLNGFSQLNFFKHTQEKYTHFKGDTSLNTRLGMYFNDHIKWEDYDTLCLTTVLFVKFTAGKRKVSGIKFSDNELPFLNNIIEKALLSTSKFWLGKFTEDYLLPFEIIFEDNCHTKVNPGDLLQMLHAFSGEQRVYTLPGYEDYKPLKCTVLNTYFIKSHWE